MAHLKKGPALMYVLFGYEKGNPAAASDRAPPSFNLFRPPVFRLWQPWEILQLCPRIKGWVKEDRDLG